MEVTIGEKGLDKTWQEKFLKEVECCKCGGKARIGFVAHEGILKVSDTLERGRYVCDLHETTGKKGGLWLHDRCAVAVYFCTKCLKPTALYNQA